MIGPIDLKRLHRVHQTFLRAHTQLEFSEAEEAGRVGVGYVHQRPKFKPRTGALQDATKSEVRVIRNRGHVIRLLNRAKYAAAIDKGSRPHGIPAKRAPYLVFFWAKMGRWVRTKRVHHPGNKPYRFLHDATWVAGRSFYGAMSRGMMRIARRF